jgi:hypothetical protein
MDTSEAHYVSVLKKKYSNPVTLSTYLKRMKSIREALHGAEIHDILMDPETYYPQLQKAYPSITTRKNLLTLILALFREDDELGKKNVAAADLWRKKHTDLTRLEQAKVRRSEPDEKQVEKYTSFEEITKKYEDLKTRGHHDTQRHSLQFLLLSVLVHLRPKRADLGAIKVYKEKDPRINDENYIVLRSKGGSYLVMNLYKTSKYYRTVEEDISEGLQRDIETSLRRYPRDYLFVKDDGDPMSNNTYSVFVKKTFEEFFGRATGVSLLRHIYITEKLNFDDMTLEEKDTEAKLMLHTSGLQQRYKWPKKTLCPKLCAAYIPPCHKTRKNKRKRSTRTNANLNTIELVE